MPDNLSKKITLFLLLLFLSGYIPLVLFNTMVSNNEKYASVLIDKNSSKEPSRKKSENSKDILSEYKKKYNKLNNDVNHIYNKEALLKIETKSAIIAFMWENFKIALGLSLIYGVLRAVNQYGMPIHGVFMMIHILEGLVFLNLIYSCIAAIRL